ncbi:MAG: T9SS type A sorting domain-containing protein [Tannerella sp.]|jgi:hypothetical protein|nr:T9SS type A sorting domain-containing protein [Tannerella sp.]
MKKYVLLLSLLPWLLQAQVSKNGPEEIFMQWTDRPSAMGGAVLRAGAVDNLPDSTYTFYGKKLHRRVGIKYNEDGLVVLEEGYTDFDYDGLVDEGLKIEYAYTREDGCLTSDGISYLKFSEGEEWYAYSRVVTRYSANGQPVKSCLYYSLGDGEWELNQMKSAVEYSERGNPVVVMDSIPSGSGLKAIARYELYYDSFDRMTGYIRLASDEREGETYITYIWVVREKVEITWDGAGRRLETSFRPSGSEGWEIDHLIETRYDERGNAISETEKGPDGEIRYSESCRHVYPDGLVTATIRPGERRSSAIYPNPSTDYVTVILPEEAPAVLTLVDLSGRVVIRQTVERQATVAVNTLPRGIYLLKVDTAGGTDVHKLIIK